MYIPPDPITYLLQSNQLTKGHSHLPTEQLIKSNQSFFFLSSLSINECLNCGASQGSSVCVFFVICVTDLCLRVMSSDQCLQSISGVTISSMRTPLGPSLLQGNL